MQRFHFYYIWLKINRTLLFNSFSFGLFLPITLILYWAVGFKKIKAQNAILLLASYFFYGLWDWRFLFLILASSLVDYGAGLAIGASQNSSRKKIYLYASILWNLGVLFVFKYYNFFIDEFALLFSLPQGEYAFSSLNLILPVGLSFYTFQTMGYSIDVYKNRIKPTSNLLNFLCFVSFFPQLVAGPIEKASDLLPQFSKKRTFETEQVKEGLRQILWGLFKKMVIADNAALIVNTVYANPDGYGSLSLLFASTLFFFQIYGDFSGYSDIAIGTAKLFGFKLSKNFKIPYLSKNVTEFWQRWHITLTRWFTDYIYFPIIKKNLGSNGQRNVAILATMGLIGLWHGANWTFVVFGLFQAMLIIIERTPFGKNRKSSLLYKKPRGPRILLPIFSFIFIVSSCILFRSQNIDEAFLIFKRIGQFVNDTNLARLLWTPLLFFLAIFIFLEVFTRRRDFPFSALENYFSKPIRWAIYYIFIFLILRYAGPTEDFIYFQF